MNAKTFRLLDLQPQDRVICHEKRGGFSDSPWEETIAYVECVDYPREMVNVLSPSGLRRTMPFSEISDVQKAENPLLATVAEHIWRAHDCDPAFLGQPVRILAVSIDRNGLVSGIELPKWPGSKPNKVLTF